MLRFVKHLMKGYCSDIPLKNRHNYRSGCHNGAHRLCAPPGWQHECADCLPPLCPPIIRPNCLRITPRSCLLSFPLPSLLPQQLPAPSLSRSKFPSPILSSTTRKPRTISRYCRSSVISRPTPVVPAEKQCYCRSR